MRQSPISSGNRSTTIVRSSGTAPVASRHPTFPILLEATREVLRDVFDVPGLREVLGDVRARRIHVVPVDTPRSSPFAQSLLFRWVSVYMYEADAPMAERRAAAAATAASVAPASGGEAGARGRPPPGTSS